MILRNGTYPGGIDLGPARNPFQVGSGTSRVHRQRSRVAAQLYAKRVGARADSNLVALAAAVVRQAIADASDGSINVGDVAAMADVYRLAQGLDDKPAPLDDIRAWLREDAERFLQDLGLPAQVDRTAIDDAYQSLLTHLQHEPIAA